MILIQLQIYNYIYFSLSLRKQKSLRGRFEMN